MSLHWNNDWQKGPTDRRYVQVGETTWSSIGNNSTSQLPSMKLTAKAPENGWLEDDSFPLGARPIFRGELLVSGSVRDPEDQQLGFYGQKINSSVRISWQYFFLTTPKDRWAPVGRSLFHWGDMGPAPINGHLNKWGTHWGYFTLIRDISP